MAVKDFLWDDEVAEIKKQHKQCQLKRYADRLKAMLLLNKGHSFAEVAEILILDDDTIRRWYHIFDDEGIEGLQRDLYKGGISKLDDGQLEALAVHVEENLFLTSKAVCHWVKSQWDIDYTESGMTGLLHALGFSYKKPTVTPGKAPTEELQRAFASKIVEIIAKKGPDDQAYFADGVHPRLNPIAGYGWIRKGERKEIPSHTGREHLNINGVINAVTHEAIVHDSEWINAQSTIELCEKIKEKQPLGKVIVFADNARYYKCKAMTEYLVDNPRIVFIHLPSYCPNLNLIERLWKFYKKKILYQQYYPNLGKMRDATLDFFERLQDYADELATLLTLNFQIVTPKVSETRK
jgi:transposase